MSAARKTKMLQASAKAEATLLAAPVPAMPDRRTFLGGSDFAAVMGLSPWHTPVDIWRLKTGRADPKPVSAARQRMFDSGKRWEPVVVEVLLEKLREQGLQVELLARNRRYTDPEHPFLQVEIDFELRVTGTVTINGQDQYLDGEVVNGDAKTVRGFARKKWGDEETEEIPIEYAAQFMGGLMVAPGQRRLCIVGALMSLDDVATYWLQRDDETIAAMRPTLVDFWQQHVVADVPPDPLRFSDVKDLYPVDNGRTVEASAEVAQALARIRALKSQVRQAEAEIEMLQLDVGAYAREFAQITVDGRPAATFRREERRELDVAALRRQHAGLVALFERPAETRVMRLSRIWRG